LHRVGDAIILGQPGPAVGFLRRRLLFRPFRGVSFRNRGLRNTHAVRGPNTAKLQQVQISGQTVKIDPMDLLAGKI
jgi:hypothetical protein